MYKLLCNMGHLLQDVGRFYAYWSSYCSSMDFHWADEYDIREAQRMGRWVEKVSSAGLGFVTLFLLIVQDSFHDYCTAALFPCLLKPFDNFSAVTSIRRVMVINWIFFRKSRRITTRPVRELGESSTRKSEPLWPMSAREINVGWSAR